MTAPERLQLSKHTLVQSAPWKSLLRKSELLKSTASMMASLNLQSFKLNLNILMSVIRHFVKSVPESVRWVISALCPSRLHELPAALEAGVS